MKGCRVAFMLALGLLLALPGFADVPIIIDFSGQFGGHYNTTGTPIIGTNIAISSMEVSGTAAMDGIYDVTGNCGSTGTMGCLNFNTGTGAISIFGSVLALSPMNLLTGTISTSALTPKVVAGNVVGYSFDASGTDHKAVELEHALGMNAQPYTWAYFGFSLESSATGEVTSSDITNTSVPEANTIVLLGMLLSGCAVALRTRRTRA